MTIKVLLNGAEGKMGRETQAHIVDQADLTLVAKTGKQDELASVITETQPDVVIDFTIPEVAFQNAETIIKTGARPVIGTSGLTLEQIDSLSAQCRAKHLGGIIAPNFSIGAILMMKYAKNAAHYLKDVEIIEMHHPDKLDAPSGTATKTAQMITEAQNLKAPTPHHDKARGDNQHGITTHSVRLPGLFSYQSVLFAGPGEMLTITHDGRSRSCSMPGVFLACRKVMELDHLVYGLENIL